MVDIDEVKLIAKELRNGSKGISNSDMNLYLLHKVDAMDNKLDKLVSKEDCLGHRNSCQKRGENKTTWMISISAMVISIIVVIINIFIH